MRANARRSCVDLSGEWSFAYAEPEALATAECIGGPAATWHTAAAISNAALPVYPCRVPGNFELDLQANGIIEEPFYGMNIAGLRRYEAAHVWYWRSFRATPPPGTQAQLVFEGVDCFAEIYLNGQLLGRTDNMLVEHTFAVDGLLQEENELLVHIRPAADEARRHDYPPALMAGKANWDSLYVRKAPHMYGWDIMPRALSAGLWRPVRLEFLPVERLEMLYLETVRLAERHESAQLALHYAAQLAAAPDDVYEIVVEGTCDDHRFATRQRALFAAGQFPMHVDQPRLWWPRGRGAPHLYDVTVTLLKNDEEIDRRTLRHGIRTVELHRTSTTDSLGNGEFCFVVNGEKVFVKGSNWVPLDAYHSRDVVRIRPAIALAAELGCNMLRCWGGNVYENDLFYDLCDEQGIMIWQDFAMACAIYPHDPAFCGQLAEEVRRVVRRLRQHPSLVLWAGDNECDQTHFRAARPRDPNTNVLTRRVLPDVLQQEDPSRPYLPSSPYCDPQAFLAGEPYLPENHLWGPRDYFKSDFYRNSLCHFASEIGYHGCPSPASIRRFISPDRVWPPYDNEEWLLHATSPVPGVDIYDGRVMLMVRQVRELFGDVPDTLEEFAFASQATQAEAKKFFIELFRSEKWRRTGILWWNLLDGWPQFSDAIVDYYWAKKLAFNFIKRAQAPLCLMFREPKAWHLELVASNDTRDDLPLTYQVRDVDKGEIVAVGEAVAAADAVTPLARVPFFASEKRFYGLTWSSPLGEGKSHYLSGHPPFDLTTYRRWLHAAGLVEET